MKLVHITTLRLSLAAALVLGFWAVAFYFVIMAEVRDEADDSLEDYAEMVILRKLRGEDLPSQSSGSNNQYLLRPITAREAASRPHVEYADRQVYIDEKNEYEPARAITYIFRTHAGQHYEIEVLTPTIDQQDLRLSILLSVVALYLVLLLSVSLVNGLTLRRSTRPLTRLLRWVEAYRLGGTNEPLHNPTGIDEFARLNTTVTAALDAHGRIYEQQNLFIGHASHEMQTPLAAAQNRIELLLDDDSLSEAQLGELLKVRRTLEGLAQLNRTLLLLCKIENGQLADRTPVSLAPLLGQLVQDCRLAHATRRIRASVEVEEDWTLPLGEQQARILLGNLLRNAFLHNREGGEVRVVLRRGLLSIANTGAEGALDERRIFTRFFRHDTSSSASSGLGLALAAAVCEQNGLALRYTYDDPWHTFILSLNKG